ncbi:hypothetical protein BV20DRAFT_779161 [Pilatotrama ljubarskyi]|nr:hypothetical protein BV20DRAFT_779161 [Pilatotrama ljubarskyi]
MLFAREQCRAATGREQSAATSRGVNSIFAAIPGSGILYQNHGQRLGPKSPSPPPAAATSPVGDDDCLQGRITSLARTTLFCAGEAQTPAGTSNDAMDDQRCCSLTHTPIHCEAQRSRHPPFLTPVPRTPLYPAAPLLQGLTSEILHPSRDLVHRCSFAGRGTAAYRTTASLIPPVPPDVRGRGCPGA